MDKVKVSKEVAEAIEYSKSIFAEENHWKIVRDHLSATSNKGFTSEKLVPLNNINPNTLIQALYIGYEVEQTPEDKVRDYFNEQYTLSHKIQDNTPFAIKYTLDLLNIKIEGVNA